MFRYIIAFVGIIIIGALFFIQFGPEVAENKGTHFHKKEPVVLDFMKILVNNKRLNSERSSIPKAVVLNP